MKGIFYPMISSRIFTASLRYNIAVEEELFKDTCEQLIKEVNNRLEDEVVTKPLGIVSCDTSIKVNDQKYPILELVIIMYATVDSNIETDKKFSKLLEFIFESYFESINLNPVEATLVKLNVY